jgi:hypothetical protein
VTVTLADDVVDTDALALAARVLDTVAVTDNDTDAVDEAPDDTLTGGVAVCDDVMLFDGDKLADDDKDTDAVDEAPDDTLTEGETEDDDVALTLILPVTLDGCEVDGDADSSADSEEEALAGTPDEDTVILFVGDTVAVADEDEDREKAGVDVEVGVGW